MQAYHWRELVIAPESHNQHPRRWWQPEAEPQIGSHSDPAWWLIPLNKWVITCYNHSYKWINPTYPIYNWGYNPLTNWDEPPSENP